MKKLIGTVAAAALLASAAFAEMNFGAWLKNLAGVVASDGDDIVAGINNPWGGWRPARFGFSYTSDDEKVGVNLGVAINQGDLDTFTPNYMWLKPWDWLKVSVGYFSDNDTGLRSDLTYGSWGWFRPNNAVRWGEGITFSDIDGQGLRLQLYPVEGLHIAALVPYSYTFKAVEDVYKNMKIGAGYTIDGIGTLKVQWHGKSASKKVAGWYDQDGNLIKEPTSTDDDDSSNAAYEAWQSELIAKKASYLEKDSASSVENLFEVAFDLVAVDGMFLTVGGAFDIAEKSDNNVYTVALGWSYKITDTFALFLDGSVKIPGDSNKDPSFGAGLGINVGLTDALNLDAEVRWLHQDKKDAEIISFLVGLNYAVSSNGGLGLGFQGLVAGKKATPGSTFPAKADKFSWAVPIYCTVYF